MKMLFAFFLIATTGAALTIPSGVELLPDDSVVEWKFYAAPNAKASKEVVSVTGMSFAKGLRVTHKVRPDSMWSIGASMPVLHDANAGDVLLLSIWLRGAPGDPSSDGARACVVFQGRRDPGFAPLRQPFRVSREWKEYFFPTTDSVNTPADDAQFALHLGFDPQTIEIGPARLVNYGHGVAIRQLPFTHFTYPGQEPDALWRKAAAERIEKFRKANLAVRVVDAAGRPVPNARVEVALKRHAFGFGTAVAPDILTGKSADSDRYRQMLAKYFNKATTENGLRWNNWQHGKTRSQALVNAMLDWLSAHGIAARGHYLAWGPLDGNSQPRDYKGKPEELRRDLFAHIEEMTRFVGNRVVEWDAVNHPIGWGPRTYMDEAGVSFYADLIRLGRKLQPKAEMWINEENTSLDNERTIKKYLSMMEELKRLGALPDGVGFMGHYKGSLLPAPEMEVNKLANSFTGVKLQFTEFDVACGADEQLQADFLRDMLTMSFSRPEFTGFVMWGFWEGHHWIPNAALWRRDWTPKPAAKAWEDLVWRQWWTRETGLAGMDGAFAVRGFLGEYEVRATGNGKSAAATATLLRDGVMVTVTLR